MLVTQVGKARRAVPVHPIEGVERGREDVEVDDLAQVVAVGARDELSLHISHQTIVAGHGIGHFQIERGRAVQAHGQGEGFGAGAAGRARSCPTHWIDRPSRPLRSHLPFCQPTDSPY